MCSIHKFCVFNILQAGTKLIVWFVCSKNLLFETILFGKMLTLYLSEQYEVIQKVKADSFDNQNWFDYKFIFEDH